MMDRDRIVLDATTKYIKDMVSAAVVDGTLHDAYMVQPHLHAAVHRVLEATTPHQAVGVLLDALEACGRDLIATQRDAIRRRARGGS